MMNKNKMSVPALLIGSFVGVVIGAAAGLAFAPKPGKQLRKEIDIRSQKAIRKAGEWKETVQEKGEDFSDKAMAKKAELKNKKRIKESNNSKMDGKSLLLGSCVGGILGASVGLAFAPKPGNELREEINTRSKDAAQKAAEWKDTVEENNTGFSDTAMNIGTDLLNKSTDATKKALGKAEEFKDNVRGNETQFLERLVNKGTDLVNKTIDVAKKLINSMDEFSAIAANINEFLSDTTEKTSDLYKDVSKKSKVLAEDVVETTTEIKEEIADHTKAVTQEAKDLKVDVEKEV